MKNLTFRYCLTQFIFWSAATGAASFATTYLLSRGLSSGVVGALLAAAGMLACLTQPILAGFVDRCRAFLLPKLLAAMSALCALCFSVQLLPNVPLAIIGLVYMLGLWLSDAMVPLLNSLSVSYHHCGQSINFGAARGIGSAASALSSLAMGYVIAGVGNYWMLLSLILLRLGAILLFLGYPDAQKASKSGDPAPASTPLLRFLTRYRWYCISLCGIAFLGMYHAMTENFMISIVSPLGGDSSHVGTALFIASMVGAPVIFFFSHIRKRFSDPVLLKIAAVTFLVRSVLLTLAPSIPAIYGTQLLQMTSYGFLAPAQVYFAQSRIRREDMVKGQAFSTAAYALGCSAGNFIGGQLLHLGVGAIFAAGIAMALTGTIIILISVDKTDCKPEEIAHANP